MGIINPITEHSFSHNADRFLRIREMLWRVGLSRSSIYRMIEAGDFPQQIQINKATVVWSENEIVAWMDQQKSKAKSDSQGDES
jgi:prophage regulatory protein